jgi:primosomal protein N' (replication factor Y) (superfamily II helicase)
MTTLPMSLTTNTPFDAPELSDVNEHFLDVIIHPLERPYTYKGPFHIAPGFQVTVPLHGRKATGYVVTTYLENPCKDPKVTIRSISKPDKSESCFLAEQLTLFQWISKYYHTPLSEVIDTAIPTLTPPKRERWVSLSQDTGQEQPKGGVQLAIIELLKEATTECTVQSLAGAGKSYITALKKLLEKGYVEINERLMSRQLLSVPRPAQLSLEQLQALDAILDSLTPCKNNTFLLHGITGSGKTEIYINAIIKARKLGLGCLVLVPEISLTPQLVSRLEEKIGERIALMHSGLTPSERAHYWRLALEGELRVVLGARSAVFSPIHNLGLIIVDEEHDSSFKQSDSLRYNGRDIAIVRAALAQCPIVLGSATPSLESYLNAKRGKYTLLEINQRHGTSKPPSLECIDLTKHPRSKMQSQNISLPLKEKIEQTIQNGNQVFLLFNRRGYASFMICDACGYTLFCEHCEVSLTYHESTSSLACHYCNKSYQIPPRCPSCSAPRLQNRGAGTEKIHEEVGKLFPTARIERLDRDSAKNLEDYRSILERVKNKEVDILVGTQMIAKGHDLPGVTLVGVVDCDVGLHMPDFRAAEKTFALLTQAAGRAGRGIDPGHVILQTRSPDHLSIVNTLKHNYSGFAENELKDRKDLGYPPYWRLMRIVASSENEELPEQALTLLTLNLASLVDENIGKLSVLGPSPAPIMRIKDRWRWHLLVKAENVTLMQRVLYYIKSNWKTPKSLRITYDIDAQEML